MKTNGSARSQIGIKEVRDNILVLPDGRYRTVLQTSSLNFELQSEEEQDALVDTFQSFLNSLTSPVQILIRVRELDIDRYLEDFESSRTDETVEVYREQFKDYSGFIRKLVAGNKILSRRFYLVVPYNDTTGDFQVVKAQLSMETEIIIKGLEKLGMTARSLPGLEILDLFYGFYNPQKGKSQPLVQELVRRTDALV
ncbi:MAG: TraC family protein [bacterium]